MERARPVSSNSTTPKRSGSCTLQAKIVASPSSARWTARRSMPVKPPP
ncbi:hypothetical protein EVA_10740 [gut metagenome]|uniref:Uncharacterized protein n=1 Tax=gut metagenome TaxID=749906 RepID=J9GH37_9ZZZZ